MICLVAKQMLGMSWEIIIVNIIILSPFSGSERNPTWICEDSIMTVTFENGTNM